MNEKFNKSTILKDSLLISNLYQTIKMHKIITIFDIEREKVFNNFCFKCFYLSFIDDAKKYKYRKTVKDKFFLNARIKLNSENTFHQQIAIYNLIDLAFINLNQSIYLFDQCISYMRQKAKDEQNKVSLVNYYSLFVEGIEQQKQTTLDNPSSQKILSELPNILNQLNSMKEKGDIDDFIKELLLMNLSLLVFQCVPQCIPFISENIDYLIFLKLFDFQVTKGRVDKRILYTLNNKSSTIYKKNKYTYTHLCFRLLFFFYLKKPHKQKPEEKNLNKIALNQIKIYIKDALSNNIIKTNQYNFYLDPYAINLYNYKSKLIHSIIPMNELPYETFDESQLNFLIKDSQIFSKFLLKFSYLFENCLFPMNFALRSLIVVYNGIISSKVKSETKLKVFRKIIHYILLNFYTDKVQFLISLNLVKEIILNLFLWRLLDIKSSNNNQYESKFNIICTMKVFRRLFSRIEYKIYFHDRLFYLFKNELEAYYYIGDYVNAKKICYYLLKNISLDQKKGTKIKQLLELCYIQLNKIKKISSKSLI